MIFLVAISTSVYAEQDEHEGIQSTVLIRSGTDWHGSTLPQYSQGTPEIAVVKFVIPPQAKLPVHKHPAINVAYVASGEITVVREEGGERNFKKGDVIVEMVGQWHYGENRSSEPVELIVFYATSPNQPLAIKK